MFQERMISMTLDKDNEVAVQTLKLLLLISKWVFNINISKLSLSCWFLLSGVAPATTEHPRKCSARRTTRACSSVCTLHSAPLPPLQESYSFQGVWISFKRSQKTIRIHVCVRAQMRVWGCWECLFLSRLELQLGLGVWVGIGVRMEKLPGSARNRQDCFILMNTPANELKWCIFWWRFLPSKNVPTEFEDPTNSSGLDYGAPGAVIPSASKSF